MLGLLFGLILFLGESVCATSTTRMLFISRLTSQGREGVRFTCFLRQSPFHLRSLTHRDRHGHKCWSRNSIRPIRNRDFFGRSLDNELRHYLRVVLCSLLRVLKGPFLLVTLAATRFNLGMRKYAGAGRYRSTQFTRQTSLE